MTVYFGVDFHARLQTVSFLDTSDGCVAANAFPAIIRPVAHPSLIGNHILETKFQSLQVASLRALAHSFMRQMVLSLSAILSRH